MKYYYLKKKKKKEAEITPGSWFRACHNHDGNNMKMSCNNALTKALKCDFLGYLERFG